MAPRAYTKGSTPTLDGSDREYVAHELGKVERSIRSLAGRTGSFTLAAAATTVVTQPAVTATVKIHLMPTNAAAATLMGSAKSLYVSAKTANASFTVATASAAAAAGTETFDYVMVP